jgi:3-oxoadipate enol-lactonase
MGPLQLFNPAGAFVSQIKAILATEGEELTNELENIECPTMVVVGNQDILTPRGDAEEIASRIPTAELVIISGGAHGLHIEHATTFNRVLLDFLKRAEKVFVPHGAAAVNV